MELRHLNTFLQVAVMQNFTKAAEVLGYSQSNVSAQISQLESELGAPLFDRIGKKATLTQYGQVLIPYAQQIVSTAAQIESLFQSKEKLEGCLRIGFVESLFECLFHQTFSNYHRQFPRVTVDITVDGTEELLKMLHTNQLDIVCLIDRYVADPDIHYWATEQCSIVAVANPAHPLARKKRLRTSDLSEQEFVLMESSAPYILELNKFLFRDHIEIASFLKVQSPAAALKLVAQEPNLLSCLPDYSVRKAVQAGQVSQLTVSGFAPKQTVQFLVHKNKVITPQIEGFLEAVHTTFLDFTQK